jgi:hypothetical protein
MVFMSVACLAGGDRDEQHAEDADPGRQHRALARIEVAGKDALDERRHQHHERHAAEEGERHGLLEGRHEAPQVQRRQGEDGAGRERGRGRARPPSRRPSA